MKRTVTKKSAKTLTPKVSTKPSKKPTKKLAAKPLTVAKLPARKAGDLRQAALEATGLAEELLHARKVQADIGLETKGKVFYAIIRVKVEDLPVLLG